MASITLSIPQRTFSDIVAHLLPNGGRDEQAAFVFARVEKDRENIAFIFFEWDAISRSEFEHQSAFHLELGDETRARLIKKAHDLQCSLIEFHSHPGPWPAQFSASDFHGLAEFVPHVWWRLKTRPYAAIVVSPTGFDALAWISSPREPQGLTAIDLEGRHLTPTGLSLKSVLMEQSWKD